MDKPLDLGVIDSRQRRILRLLIREWDRVGPPGIVDLKELAVRLDVTLEAVYKAAKPLYTQGVVDRNAAGLALFLTPEGRAAAIEALKP